MPLPAGVQAPDFKLMDDGGRERRLSDFRGRTVVLYFYPRDDTPGCTTEACSFRDEYSEYVKADVIVLGISADGVRSHERFKEKFNLPFPLLVDEGHQVASLYEVWGLKKFMGREFEGIHRTTFLIDGRGMIVRVFENVKPAGHAQEVLSALKPG